MKKNILMLMLTIMALAACKEQQKISHEGRVSFLKGKAWLQKGSAKSPLKTGSIVKEGDQVVTGKESVAIIIFDGSAKLEVQPESSLSFEDYNKASKEIFLQKGNLWLDVAKAPPGQKKYVVRTPTSVAGVRGTRFYTFQFGDMRGTCHCEGEVEYQADKHNYKEIHKKHELVLHHKGKMVKLHQKHFTDQGIAWQETHAHSHLPDSPVGPQFLPTKEEIEIRQKVIAGHLAKAK